MSTCLTRDTCPSARSLAWSPRGLSSNAGCLLALCTSKGHVKLYRRPFSEFFSEWIEVADISNMLLNYFVSINFGEFDILHVGKTVDTMMEKTFPNDFNKVAPRKSTNQKKLKVSRKGGMLITNDREDRFSSDDASVKDNLVGAHAKECFISGSIFSEGSEVEILRQEGLRRVWVRGTIKCLQESKALVCFLNKNICGEEDLWVGVNAISATLELSNVSIGAGRCPLLPIIRPYTKLGSFPENYLFCEIPELENILKIGQQVEVWTTDSWVEGIFMGYDDRRLLVKLTGENDPVPFDQKVVRLAPTWNGCQNSWHVTVIEIDPGDIVATQVSADKLSGNCLNKNSSMRQSGECSLKRKIGIDDRLIISAGQYAAHSSKLSSLVVAWSPLIQISHENSDESLKTSCKAFSILVIGGKSGEISIWVIQEPPCYTIEYCEPSVDVKLVGILKAHNSWITAISCGVYGVVDFNSKIVLSSGSSDGSVKIWSANAEMLIKSTKINDDLFSLVKEVITAPSPPVSTLSLTTRVSSSKEYLFLAVGKGSGCLEAWICNMTNYEFQSAGSCHKHDQMVTGLAWASNGSCLYSCGQDNSVHSWILQGNSLHGVPFPSNSPSMSADSKHSYVSDGCFGLALSSGNLVAAVVRSLDSFHLDQMYQARTQKSLIEFFWIGEQELKLCCLNQANYPNHLLDALSNFSSQELLCWEFNLLRSLEKHENVERPLVLWDVILALSSFKKASPDYVEHVLFKWMSSSLMKIDWNVPIEDLIAHVPGVLSEAKTRQLHILNLLCRHLLVEGFEDRKLLLWLQILNESEKELRQRLVTFSLSAVLNYVSCPDDHVIHSHWVPLGTAQMQKWIYICQNQIKEQLKLLGSEISKIDGRLQNPLFEYTEEEKCSICSSLVKFESPEIAICEGKSRKNGFGHQLTRCAVSMQVCSMLPSWVCVSCKKQVFKLPSYSFFTTNFLSNFRFMAESFILQEKPKPLCPFCGILLQRSLPDFLLSTSPV